MKKMVLAGVLALGVVSAQTYNPTVHWGDLLGFRFFPKNGQIQFDGVQIAFPKQLEGGYALELRKNGKQIASKELRLTQVSGFPAFGYLEPVDRAMDAFTILESGKYEWAIRGAGADISVATFDANVKSSGDAFNPTKTVHLSGAWEKAAFLMANDGDPNAQLHVIGWVLGAEMPAANADKWLTVQLLKGSRVLGKSNVFIGADLLHWTRYRFDLTNTNRLAFKISDLTKIDGDYLLEFRSKSKLLRKFAIKVRGKKIERISRNTVTNSGQPGSIAAKFVNSDLVMQEVFWLDVAK
jgi:hypothetical protein